MKEYRKKIIVIGVGNDLRGDDAIGKEFIQNFDMDGVEKFFIPFLDIDIMEKIKEYDIVIFVDASVREDNFKLSKVDMDKSGSAFIFSHYPLYETIIALIKQLYNPSISGYILEIGGKDFDYKTYLSTKAKDNIRKAQKFLKKFIKNLL